MKSFLFRICCLMVSSGLIIIHTVTQKGNITLAIFIITGVLLLYFVMPLVKIALLNYLLILLLIALTIFISSDLTFILPLLAFILIESAFRLKERKYPLFIAIASTLCFSFFVFNMIALYSFLLMIAITVCCFFLHQYLSQVEMKTTLYEQLLSQFRKIKRDSVEQEELVRSEERTKIARDMHDSVGHKLTSLLMQLEMLSIENQTHNLIELKQLARESLEETRFAVRQLKSTETTGLQSVILLIRKLEMESHLHIRFTIEKGVLSIPISNEQSVVLYRVLQECLTNAMKHSQSKEVEVTLTVDSLHHILFEVKNKLVSDLPLVKGFGLTNMEGRLQEIHGQLRVLRDGKNFIVRGSFPLKR
ncbi:signal transduction histidine kinase [Ureibacillus xyleni]|uniref:histidine kinase n=2 Tax=Ureibacillus xyleni TaxID=614648 RepID=A0A285TFU5_9BACL|nr:signal transduction histidine kinase [Ureibacillus xyleni]